MNIFEQQEEIMKMVKSSFATKEASEEAIQRLKVEDIREKILEYNKETKEANEEAEIDEGGEEITGEDEEKIADAIDTTDLGARSDMEWAKEKDERLGL